MVICVLFISIWLLGYSRAYASEQATVKIHYLGHASFILPFDNGISVLTDYGISKSYGLASPIYNFGDFQPEVVTYSHRHDDHFRPGMTFEKAQILTETDSLSIDGLEIVPIRTHELSVKQADNTSYLFRYKGLKILHLADAQALIKNIEKEEIRTQVKALYPGTYDLVLMTIEGRNKLIPQSEVFIDLLQPARVIPMHYWSPEYKAKFLEHLTTQNEKKGRHYHIEEAEKATYVLATSDTATPITVISLNPENFSSQN